MDRGLIHLYLCLGGLSLLATIAANGLTSRDYFDNVVSNLLERMAWGLPTQFVTLAATVYIHWDSKVLSTL